MRVGLGTFALACVPLFPASAAAQTATDDETPRIALNIPSGAPLRLYLGRGRGQTGRSRCRPQGHRETFRSR